MEKGTYTGLLEALNAIRIRRWIIRPGMGFGAAEKWWDGGIRAAPHNGLDLRLYEDADGREAALGEATLVPALEDGEAVTIIRDFLGESVFVAHSDGIISAYGHLRPLCRVGDKLRRGQAIAKLSERPGMPVPPHLHISLLRLPKGFDVAGLTWRALDGAAEFLDPAGIIETTS